MGALNRLNDRTVKTAKDGWHSDGGNLYLKVDGNRRRWVYRYVRNGKVNEIGLGGAATVSLAAARKLRQKTADDIAQGVDVRAERQKAEDSVKSFAYVAQFVIERDKPRWGASSLRSWRHSLEGDAEKLSALSVAAITVDDVKQVVMPMFDRGDHVAARRTLSRIEEVLSCAIAHGWREKANVAAWSIFEHIAPKRERADRRHPMLPWREAPAAFARMRASRAMTAQCLAFIALTAVRALEARGMRWDEIDFDAATWTIPAERMKMRAEHIVPLSKQALEILAELKARATPGDFVFAGLIGGHVSKTALWLMAKQLTDDRASPHGFRATFRSWCADNGIDREVAESALAHRLGGVEGAYNRAAMVERRRKVMQAWGAFLVGESSASVIPFAGKRG